MRSRVTVWDNPITTADTINSWARPLGMRCRSHSICPCLEKSKVRERLRQMCPLPLAAPRVLGELYRRPPEDA